MSEEFYKAKQLTPEEKIKNINRLIAEKVWQAYPKLAEDQSDEDGQFWELVDYRGRKLKGDMKNAWDALWSMPEECWNDVPNVVNSEREWNRLIKELQDQGWYIRAEWEGEEVSVFCSRSFEGSAWMESKSGTHFGETFARCVLACFDIEMA